jgi:hypothetical protein
MPATPTAAHEAPPTQQPLPGLTDHAPDSRDSHTHSRRHQPRPPAHPPTDDEILGLDTAPPRSPDPAQAAFDFDAMFDDAESAPASESAAAASASNHSDESSSAEPANFRNIFEANPELRRAWQDANAYRETFPTPEAARAATAQLADLDRMDALFFSRRPEDHAELARVVATLDPNAFASLAQAMSGMVASGSVGAQHAVPGEHTWRDAAHRPSPNGPVIPSEGRNLSSGGQGFSPDINGRAKRDTSLPQAVAQATPQRQSSAPTAAQAEFFHAANAAAVEGVLDAIESQVERLLPEGVSKSARTRVVGEIYRELDTTLRSNRQLGQQMRDAFRSGSLDTDHQRAIVSLVTGRARQALPAVAKRVLNEWTSTVVAANNDRRARQHAAERRIDISGASGAASAGRSASPRSVDYARMSDSDILNL